MQRATLFTNDQCFIQNSQDYNSIKKSVDSDKLMSFLQLSLSKTATSENIIVKSIEAGSCHREIDDLKIKLWQTPIENISHGRMITV